MAPVHGRGGPGHAGYSLDESIRPPFKLLWTFRLDGDACVAGGVAVDLKTINEEPLAEVLR